MSISELCLSIKSFICPWVFPVYRPFCCASDCLKAANTSFYILCACVLFCVCGNKFGHAVQAQIYLSLCACLSKGVP